jgi:dolichol kinase
VTTFSIIIAIASVAALFAMAYGVRAAGLRFGWPAEAQRKLVHVGVGVHAMLLPLVLDRASFFVFAVLALVALLILRSPWGSRGAGASVHSVERRSWGDLLFLLSVAVLFVRAPGSPALYVLPIAVLTLSDAAAAVIGTAYGRRRFGSGDRIKSIEGTAVFFVVTWMVAVTILITATEVPRLNTVLLATVVAAFAAQVEAESWKGLDNIFVPLGIHALLSFNGDADPLLLALLAAAFVGSMAVAQLSARFVGMTPHALRSTAVCLFLTAGMTAPRHAILPVAAFVAHVASRRDAQDPELDDLDFVAVVCLIGVFWLALAGITGKLGTEFYTITFAGVLAGLAVLCLQTRVLDQRLAAAAAISVATFLVQRWVIWGDGPDILWAGRTETAVTAALTIAACAFGAAWRPILPYRRGPMFTALALAIPAVAYALACRGG